MTSYPKRVDVGSLVAGDSVFEQVDGASLGRAVGEAVGAFAGRYLGRAVFDWLVSGSIAAQSSIFNRANE